MLPAIYSEYISTYSISHIDPYSDSGFAKISQENTKACWESQQQAGPGASTAVKHGVAAVGAPGWSPRVVAVPGGQGLPEKATVTPVRLWVLNLGSLFSCSM